MADEVTVDVDFNIRPFTDDAEGVFSVVAGVDPYILITPQDTESSFNLDSTGVSREELIWVLEALAHTLKNGEITL